jgi:hypothetical protein
LGDRNVQRGAVRGFIEDGILFDPRQRLDALAVGGG